MDDARTVVTNDFKLLRNEKARKAFRDQYKMELLLPSEALERVS